MLNSKIFIINKLDYALVGIVLFISFFLIYYYYIFSIFSLYKESKAQIYDNNHLIYTLPLNQDRIISYRHMHFEINNRRIRVLDSDCPRQVCVLNGWISKPSQRIICIPNRIIIEISGQVDHDDKNHYDYEIR